VDAGEPVAMIALDRAYESGLGVAKDCPEVLRLYQASAKAGLAPAVNDIGLMYDKGSCVRAIQRRPTATMQKRP
jgi:TPR repeat protein